VQFSVIAILFLLLYYPIFPGLYHAWIASGIEFHSDNSYGILVPFISVFLIWKNRKRIPWKDVRPSSIGLAIVVASLIIYLIAYAGGILVIARLAMLTALMGLVLYNLGKDIFRSFLFPFLFLFFMIPIPYSILSLVSLPLQTMVTGVAAHIIKDVFSLPVMREGNMLYFTTTSLEVAEACSGIRSLMTFLMLGSLFAYMSKGSYKSKAFFLAMAVPLAVFTNLLRVTGTGILGHFYGPGVAKGFLHEFSGFAVLAVGLVMMMGMRKLLAFAESKLKSKQAVPNKG
jgi:exosortase